MQRIAFLLLLILARSSLVSAQTTWHVDASAVAPGDGSAAQPYADLQFALGRPTTVSGDTLLVEPGTYVGGFDFLGKDVIVRSTQGAAVTILDGNLQQDSVVNFSNGEGPNAVLDGFSITRGKGTLWGTNPTEYAGGGIRCIQASPTLVRLDVHGNYSEYGAGIYLEGSSASVSHSTIRDNRPQTAPGTPHHALGVGIYSTLPTAVVEWSTIENNGYSIDWFCAGGGLFGKATVRDCIFRANRSTEGGAIFTTEGTVERCRFESNTLGADDVVACTSGGAIAYGVNPYGFPLTFGLSVGPLVVRDCEFVGNRGHRGGAICCSLGVPAQVERSVFIGNAAPAWYSSQSGSGGATVGAVLTDCELAYNTAGSRGGGLYSGGALRCRIHHNEVELGLGTYDLGGGGAHSASLIDCDVTDNVAHATTVSYSAAQGGGSYGGSALHTRYFRNRAQYGGGAARGMIDNCTLLDNLATVGGGGLAATSFVVTGASLQARNVICRSNLPNEIATQGTAVASVTYSNVEGSYAGGGNFDADPMFLSPRAYDVHLKPSSPCIDAGDPSAPLDPDGTVADVGAFAFDATYCSSPAEWCEGKPNSLGCVPEITFSGSPTVTGADDFHVSAANFLGANFGLLAWSRTPSSIPFQGGTLCLAGPFFRAGLQFAGGSSGVCDGSYVFHFSQGYRASFGIQPYETIYVQWFARDAANPDGTGWSLSNGLEFTVCP